MKKFLSLLLIACFLAMIMHLGGCDLTERKFENEQGFESKSETSDNAYEEGYDAAIQDVMDELPSSMIDVEELQDSLYIIFEDGEYAEEIRDQIMSYCNIYDIPSYLQNEFNNDNINSNNEYTNDGEVQSFEEWYENEKENDYNQSSNEIVDSQNNDYNDHDTCLAAGCDNIPNNLNFYCSEHACAKNGCNSIKSYSSSFCTIHKCDSVGCDNGRKDWGNYCSEHACADSGCSREKTFSGNYCSWHECNDVMCENKAKEYGSYCSEHECANPYCTSKKSSLSDYCYIHDD